MKNVDKIIRKIKGDLEKEIDSHADNYDFFADTILEMVYRMLNKNFYLDHELFSVTKVTNQEQLWLMSNKWIV